MQMVLKRKLKHSLQSWKRFVLPMAFNYIWLHWHAHCWDFQSPANIQLRCFAVVRNVFITHFGVLSWLFDNLIVVNCLPRNWFKGNDTTSLLIFLEHRLRSEMPNLDPDQARYFGHMLAACEAANKFMSCVFHAALWLSPVERDTLLVQGHTSATCFQELANEAYMMEITRWKLMPKLHVLGELLFRLEYEKKHHLPSISPLAWSCQQDEDFVGRIAFQSRVVSIRSVHYRTLTRYQVALASRWWLTVKIC